MLTHEIAACLDENRCARIQAALDSEGTEKWLVTPITLVSAADRALGIPSGTFDVAIIDAAEIRSLIGPETGYAAVARRLTELSTPLILVATLGQNAKENMRVSDGVLGLARRQLPFETVFVWPNGEHCIAWMEHVQRAVLTRASSRVAMSVLSSADLLDNRLKWFVSDLFRRPEAYRSSDHVMKSLQVDLTIQRVDRLLASGGLVSFEKLRRVARVTRAYEMLGRWGWTVAQVVRRLGYGSDDAVTSDVRKVAGVTPGEWKRLSRASLLVSGQPHAPAFDDVAFLDRAVAYCLRSNRLRAEKSAGNQQKRGTEPSMRSG